MLSRGTCSPTTHINHLSLSLGASNWVVKQAIRQRNSFNLSTSSKLDLTVVSPMLQPHLLLSWRPYRKLVEDEPESWVQQVPSFVQYKTSDGDSQKFVFYSVCVCRLCLVPAPGLTEHSSIIISHMLHDWAWRTRPGKILWVRLISNQSP